MFPLTYPPSSSRRIQGPRLASRRAEPASGREGRAFTVHAPGLPLSFPRRDPQLQTEAHASSSS